MKTPAGNRCIEQVELKVRKGLTLKKELPNAGLLAGKRRAR